MLTQLQIHHFAIVDHLVLSFNKGLSVITGETGAGKSIIIDALNLLLGKPASDEWIKVGHDSAWIEATITLPSTKDTPNLHPYIDTDAPTQFTFFRKLSRNKSNKARINCQSVTLKELKQCLSPLIHIVGQHHSIKILDPEIQRDIVDSTASLLETPEYTEFQTEYRHYHVLKQELNSISSDKQQRQQELEFIQFQLNDLQTHQFQENEEDQLKAQKNKLKVRSQQLRQLSTIQHHLQQAHEHLTQAHQETISINTVPQPIETALTELPAQVEPLLEWCHSEIQSYQALETVDIDTLESRLDLIFKYKTKYNVQHINDLIQKIDSLTQRKETLMKSITDHSALNQDLQTTHQSCLDKAKVLSQMRQKAAKILETNVTKDCMNLHFSHCQVGINVNFNPALLSEQGADQVEWLISTNKGIPVGTLSQVASGGELSRLMLAVESNTVAAHPAQTMIFDEVDTGIGGLTASSIGRYLEQIAQHKQVLCITHLVQIAQLAHHHMTVEKFETTTSTSVKAHYLSPHDTADELKRLVGGTTITSLLTNECKKTTP